MTNSPGAKTNRSIDPTVRPSEGVLLLCRPGFERECGEEWVLRTQTQPPIFKENSGFVYGGIPAVPPLQKTTPLPVVRDLVFTRHLISGAYPVGPLPELDRVSPIMEAAATLVLPTAGSKGFGTVVVDHADSDQGRELSRFCTTLARPLANALKKRELLEKPTPGHAVPRLHVFLADAGHGYVGYTHIKTASPWPMGIPRLRYPSGAPSRAVLKIEEAFSTFFPSESISSVLSPGMTAIDLGAAPGGWTWFLAKKQIYVQAIDNGALASSLTSGPLADYVDHLEQDAFKFSPRRSVDWLFCDLVEQPKKVSALVADWIAAGRCKRALFNLKLPMKDRLAEVQRCLEPILDAARLKGLTARAKHLYHDRLEITVVVA